MKTSAIDRRSGSTLLPLIALALWVSVAHAQVGRTPGTFAVSTRTGAATYTIPIFAPTGPAGLHPNIALVYNSQSGNGYVGVGWNVSGLSAITRCNLTYAQDATSSSLDPAPGVNASAPAPITLTTSDGYCLDGARLRLTGGTYGMGGSTYETEIANFSLVTANGSTGNGPATFTVQTRDGNTFEYGNGGSSAVPSTGTPWAWLLDKVTDRAGNTMVFTYTQATGSAVPATISWTPSNHGSTTYEYVMQFNYGANVPQSSIYGYVAGTSVINTNLLSSITMSYAGSEVKEYDLTYQQSPTTSRYELQNIAECINGDCLSPTTFTYQSGALGVSSSAATAATNVGAFLGVYDFDGDGRDDLLYTDTQNNLWVAFGASGGFGTPVSTGITLVNQTSRFLPAYWYPFTVAGDVHGAGYASILTVVNGYWWEYAWNTQSESFSGANTGLQVDTSTEQTAALEDVNGDGLLDLVTAETTSSALTVYTRLNTLGTPGGPVSFSSTRTTAYTNTTQTCGTSPPSTYCWVTLSTTQSNSARSIDFNADGRGDLVVTQSDEACLSQCRPGWNQFALVAGNAGFTLIPISLNSAYTGAAYFADFNNDGCTDIYAGNAIYIAGCDGTAPQIVTAPASFIGTVDWDGDGRTDFLVANGSTAGVYLSTGTGLSSLISTSLPVSYTLFTANPTGDGLNALVAVGSAITYYLHNGAGQLPDLMSSVTDGYGNSASPTYSSVAQSSYTKYSGGEGSAAYPYKNYVGPLYVVNNVTFSDPSNPPSGTYQKSFTYYSAWMNLQGRGLGPFYETQVVDSRDGTYRQESYQPTFPWTGLFSWSWHREPNGSTPITQKSTSSTYAILQSTPYQEVFFPYITQLNTEIYEVNPESPIYGEMVTDASTTYSYDNYGNAKSIVTALTDEDPNSPYKGDSWTTTTTNTPAPNTSTWCLNLLSQSQVTYSSTLSGSGSVTITKNFTPDTTSGTNGFCQYTQIVAQPSSSYQVTEALGYDVFGNVNSDTVTGVGMTPRTTITTWSNADYTTGQFPLSIQDPSGATTEYTYNYSFGLKSTAEDPNQLTTSWLYDEFGRVATQKNPDGTYKDCAYRDAASYGFTFHGLRTNCGVYASNNSIISANYTMSDSEDRPYLTLTQSLDSGYNRTDIRYDNLNRLSAKSAPCAFGAWTSECPDLTTTSYDALNRATQVQRPISSTDSNLQTTTYSYSGRTETITDPYNNSRTLIHDVNGWLRQTKDAYGYAVTLAYDAAGDKTLITDSESNTLWTGTYGYGLSAYLTSETDIDRGAWSYTVDALGERTGWTDAKGKSFGESYDALSRPSSRSEPDLFTQWTWGSTPSSHNVGKLVAECTGTPAGSNPPDRCTADANTTPGYSETEMYDAMARHSQRSITLPSAGTFTYTWQYSSTTGLLSSLTYPTSTNNCQVVVDYGYSYGVLTSITDGSNQTNCGSTGTVYWQANDENDNGQYDEWTLGNGIVVNLNIDHVTHWVGSIQAGAGGGSGVKNLSFLYDEMGDVTQRQDNNLGLTENVYYDNDYRLSYTQLNGTQNLSLTYDANGNITSRSDIAAGASWTYDSTHKHEVKEAGSSSYTYSYDANGNTSTRQGQTIGWSSYNYPTSISAGSGGTAESISLYYGPDRQRWYQYYTGNGETEGTYYVGKELEVVTSGSSTNYRHYIYARNVPIAVYSRSSSGTNAVDYVLSDHQGSVAALTNSSGGTIVSESFTPYGNRRNPTTWSGAASNTDLTTAAGITRQGYTFQTQLGLWMGMNHMNGRVEDSITGRFMSPDPRVQDANNPQDYNPYSYTVNNPLTLTDPTGFAYTCTVIPIYNPVQVTESDLAVGDDDNPSGFPTVTITAPQLPTEYITQCSDPYFENPTLTPPATPPNLVINTGSGAAGRRGPQHRNSNCLNQRFANFFADQYPAALPVAIQYNVPITFLLSLSAWESGYGTGNPSLYAQHDPFGATPGGDSTPGLSYSSFGAAWQAWGQKWGPDVTNVTDISTFLEDLHNKGYNSEVPPLGDANWAPGITSVLPSVQQRLNQFLNGAPTCQ